MRTITKKEQLAGIKEDLERGIAFIKSDKTEVVRLLNNKKYAIDKNVGSDLCYLYNALDEVNNLLANKKVMGGF